MYLHKLYICCVVFLAAFNPLSNLSSISMACTTAVISGHL